MGSVGAHRSRRQTITVTPTPQPQPPVQPQPAPPQPPVSQQTPSPSNTPVTPQALDNLTKMSDSQMAALVNSSVGIQMPNMLADVKDATQSFVFAAGLNEKPMVLDAAAFNQFMKDNNISQSEVLSRSVNSITYKNQQGTQIKLSADQINQMSMYSRLNYIGGKVGGQALGAGTYFDMNGGRGTGYGGTTVNAVLNPKTAKVIKYSDVSSEWNKFSRSHPQTARTVNNLRGNTESIKALLMGYNVISRYGAGATSGYHNVIDRSALVYKE